MGLGPAVYFEIISGKMICNGIMGTAIKANFSLGKPASISFKLVTASQAEKPIYDIADQVNTIEVAIY